MGIIARQGIKRSLLSVIGTLIGVFSIMVIYPLANEAYGFAQFIYSTAVILSMVLGFGSSGLVIKYFTEFKKENFKGYLGVVLSFAFINILIISIFILIFRQHFFTFLIYLGFDIDLIINNITAIYGLAILVILIRFMIYQASNFNRIVIPALINEFGYKIFLPFIILLFYYKNIYLEQIGYLLLAFYALSLVLNYIYLKKIGGVSIGENSILSLSKKKVKEMYSYMGFSGLNSLSGNVTTRIDAIMIPLLTSLAGNGIYSIFLFMSNTISIPNNSLNQIASPIIANSIANNDFSNVNNIYKKTSLNSYLIGAILFIIIWSILPDIIQLMPSDKDFHPFIYVFFFLGIAKLVDMLTSINSYIIIYSKYYKYNLLFLLVLAILNLVLNYFLINKYGIVGAAIATLSSMILYNLAKLVFIKIKFDLFPFNFNTIKIVLISFIVFFISVYLPNADFVIINLVYKPFLLILLYYILIKTFRIEGELIELGEGIIIKIHKKLFIK